MTDVTYKPYKIAHFVPDSTPEYTEKVAKLRADIDSKYGKYNSDGDAERVSSAGRVFREVYDQQIRDVVSDLGKLGFSDVSIDSVEYGEMVFRGIHSINGVSARFVNFVGVGGRYSRERTTRGKPGMENVVKYTFSHGELKRVFKSQILRIGARFFDIRSAQDGVLGFMRLDVKPLYTGVDIETTIGLYGDIEQNKIAAEISRHKTDYHSAVRVLNEKTNEIAKLNAKIAAMMISVEDLKSDCVSVERIIEAQKKWLVDNGEAVE
jgi:hypothetical protein